MPWADREAEITRKAMTQISGAIIGITLVLTAVFVPMACPGTRHRLEAEHGSGAALDAPVILFDLIVEILALADADWLQRPA